MGTFNTDDFEGVEKTCGEFVLKFTDTMLGLLVLIKELYIETVHPLYLRYIEPNIVTPFYDLIYGDMNKRYPPANEVSFVIEVQNGEYIDYNLTSYWNDIVLPIVRKNYGRGSVSNLHDLLLNYHVHNCDFESIENMSNINRGTLEIVKSCGKEVIINGMESRLVF
jgi:hypothetical protein